MNDRTRACSFLRCKQDSYTAEQPNVESMTPRIWWCGKTLGSFGPDGEVAGLEECQARRGCYSEQIEGNALEFKGETIDRR